MPGAALASVLARRGVALRRALRARALFRARERAEEDRVRRRRRRRRIAAGLGILALMVMAPLAAIIVAIGGTRAPNRGLSGVSAAAMADVPPEVLTAYRDAAAWWQIDWAILAAVGKVECDHGRSPLSGCNPPDTINRAGARGYMQFLGNTWRRSLGRYELEPRSSAPAADGQGYATDGDGDGDADPWSWPDAASSAARYLQSLGLATNAEEALFGYNRSRAYVEEVLGIAQTYRAAAAAVGPGSYEGAPGNVPLTTVEGITVHTGIAEQVGGLVRAARADGFTLTGGGYRDPGRQIELRRQHCGSSQYAIYEMPSSQCSPPTARPGTSNHEMGLAVDFSCNGALIRSRSSACFSWLQSNAEQFGLRNLPSEPWHWSVDGT